MNTFISTTNKACFIISILLSLIPQIGYTQDTCTQFTGKVVRHLCERELVIQTNDLPTISTGLIKPTYIAGIQAPPEGTLIQFDFNQQEVGTHFWCGNPVEHAVGVIECLTITGFDCHYRYGGTVNVLMPGADSTEIILELVDEEFLRYIRPVISSRIDVSEITTGDRVRIDFDNLHTPPTDCDEIAYVNVRINCLERLSSNGCGTFMGTVVEDACGKRFYQTEGLQVASDLINPGRWEVLPNLGATIQFFFKEQTDAWIQCGDSSIVTAFGYIDCFEVIDDGMPPDQCTITISNRECRTIGVYDENDNLLTTLSPAPSIISPFYQVTLSVWDDPQPLPTNTTRKYIFKQNDLIVGSQIVSCAQPFITVVNEFGDGCSDALGFAPVNNIGCTPLQVFGTDGNLIQTVAPKEEVYLEAFGFHPIYVLVADGDTLAIGSSFDATYFNAGSCTEAPSCVLLIQNDGRRGIEIFDGANNLLSTLWGRSSYELLLPADTTLNFIFKEEGKFIGCQTVSCNQPQIIIDDFCSLNGCDDLSTIEGNVFLDSNSNGQQDESEKGLPNIPIEIASNTLTIYTDENGNFRFFVEDGIYPLSVKLDSCWTLSTDSLSYTITIEGSATSKKISFGLQLTSNYQHSQARIISAPTRCGFTVPFQMSVENDGCQPTKGRYGLVLSPLATLVSANIGRVEQQGDTLFWEYEELVANQIQTFPFTFEIAGANFIGEQIEMTGLSYIEDEFGNLSLSSVYSFNSEIRCAYDPNDKLVTPNRLQAYEENYTLFDESLEYTIRFQNTGNDTAFNVVIRDTLDKQLDWSTFQPIVASHSYQAFLAKDGAVEFSFEDILLPDSTTNEPLSHGFVTYKISPKKGLPENAIIGNTASIYFDFNPPIVTNTTRNVMVSELPKNTTSMPSFSLENVIYVYPNPFNNRITIEQRHTCSDCVTFTLLDVTGNAIQSTNLKEMIQTITLPSLTNGLYFYQIKNEEDMPVVWGKLINQ